MCFSSFINSVKIALYVSTLILDLDLAQLQMAMSDGRAVAITTLHYRLMAWQTVYSMKKSVGFICLHCFNLLLTAYDDRSAFIFFRHLFLGSSGWAATVPFL